MNSKVAVVDDDDAIRDAISLTLESVGISVLCYASALDFFNDPAAGKCRCVILDVRMPGLSGTEAQRRINALGMEIPVIFITGHGDVTMAVDVMKRGAIDFLQKPFRDQQLIEAVQNALLHARDSDAKAGQRESFNARFNTLTPRERDVFMAVARGHRTKQIAADLRIATKTVEEYRARIFSKMGVTTSGALAAMAAGLQQDE